MGQQNDHLNKQTSLSDETRHSGGVDKLDLYNLNSESLIPRPVPSPLPSSFPSQPELSSTTIPSFSSIERTNTATTITASYSLSRCPLMDKSKLLQTQSSIESECDIIVCSQQPNADVSANIAPNRPKQIGEKHTLPSNSDSQDTLQTKTNTLGPNVQLCNDGLKVLNNRRMLNSPSKTSLSPLHSPSITTKQPVEFISGASSLVNATRSIITKMGILRFAKIDYNRNNIKIKSQSNNQLLPSKGKQCQTKSTLNNEHSTASSNNNNNSGSATTKPYPSREDLYEEPPYHIALMCYLSYVVLICFGYFQDFLRTVGLSKNLGVEHNRDGYPRLYKNFESFYTRNIYRRIRDAFNRPISSVPGAYIDVVDRVSKDHNWTFQHPGTTSRVLNMGSYNYLGFAENSGPIHDEILEVLKARSVGVGSTRNEFGFSDELDELETLMSQFLGVESSIVIGMGFATNSTNIRCLATKGCLIISDQLNHASLCLGCRLSGATIRTFKHNDVKDLERKIRRAIIEGQPRSHRPWRKIILLVEGIYSMEGTIVNLPELIRLKKLYNCYLYVDEAHSIGALGSNGRGVVDYYGCNPGDVDILMGTFTKSFGAAGGYIAGRRELIEHIRRASYASYYATAMSPVIAKQISSVVRVLMNTDDGRQRIEQLARNTHYFRQKLKQNGFIILGNDDSPVVPLMLCFCPAIACVIRLAFHRGLGFIGAGFPATSLTTGRVRFCISAAHTKSMLDESLQVMNEIGDKIGVKYSRREINLEPIEY